MNKEEKFKIGDIVLNDYGGYYALIIGRKKTEIGFLFKLLNFCSNSNFPSDYYVHPSWLKILK